MADGQEKIKVYSLSIGVEQNLLDQLGESLSLLENTVVSYDMDKLLTPAEPAPSIIFCGAPPDAVSINEVAQLMRMQYQDAVVYLLVGSNSKYDRKFVIKNGITDIFFLPLDKNLMIRTVSEFVAHRQREGKVYRPVKLLDMQANTTFNFDTYIFMPVNKKHIKYSSSGEEMEEDRINKLKRNNVNSLFIDKADMPKFYSYTAGILKKLNSDTSLSETERSDRLQSSIRELVSGLFNDTATDTEEGRKVVEDCQKVVRAYVTDGKTENWYDRIITVASNSTDMYSRAANVSSYAALFGIALGLKTVEDIALAGLLHEVGMAMVPMEILQKSESERTRSEQDEFRRYPELGISLIKDRKLVVSPLVHKIILQHRENNNGTGYPKGISGDRICIEAKLVALAMYFDDLTAISPGKPRLSPREAIKKMQEMASENPAHSIFDPELLRKVLNIFPGENEEK